MMKLHWVLQTIELLLLLFGTSYGALVSITFDGSAFEMHEGVARGWVARGNFTDNTFVDGWGYLEIETNPAYPDTVQAYAAGFAEGAASQDMIYNAYRYSRSYLSNSLL
ncbi:hypothetical protein SK128_016231 [Halocaridina rubra]|uniref:Phospholipase B-like n=1 Tax=Halocaridina rubra TaxID=373956 RepID=A0AAN8X178_HALRR